MTYIKAEFVKRILTDEGTRLLKNQGIEIAKRLHFHSFRLTKDRTVKINSADDMDGELSHTHPDYERFLDMKRMIRSKKTNRIASRSYRIHNRFMYGHYFSIANRLMYEFTEEVRQGIINDFKNQ